MTPIPESFTLTFTFAEVSYTMSVIYRRQYETDYFTPEFEDAGEFKSLVDYLQEYGGLKFRFTKGEPHHDYDFRDFTANDLVFLLAARDAIGKFVGFNYIFGGLGSIFTF